MPTTENDWVSDFIIKASSTMNGVVNLNIGGIPVTAELGAALLQFFETNRAFLLRLGQESFTDFLYLLHEKKEEEAFLLLSSKMDADDIILAMNGNANILTQCNDEYDQFMTQLKGFATMVVLPLLARVIIGLLV